MKVIETLKALWDGMVNPDVSELDVWRMENREIVRAWGVDITDFRTIEELFEDWKAEQGRVTA